MYNQYNGPLSVTGTLVQYGLVGREWRYVDFDPEHRHSPSRARSMTPAHLYFHVRSGEVFVRDTEGAEFASLEQASAEAIRDIREMVARQLLAGTAVNWDDAIEIWDTRATLWRTTFRAAVGL